ncbi:MAG: 2,3,4,5-tetrahydropyridine-2,6-dicarboxylate N-succinyltransferase [Deltaproteobacteria bacterium RIFOXYA12_FULL_58_15]|nr:MAG: 2,3,4,5-tetrahydropyridine-2,6-dicarboxylate N-succinyltransferase [Deltaproteobacteria bacterium RIFOXYA12_FULL_58_15]OGR09522.1 MAG: 2,3,4,5-tetrahydropyridine-2,6-dicarboxylate N-succinyltransferase [Deltaproteobacteria bacterium RIFOXYB12_FULL_58_9]
MSTEELRQHIESAYGKTEALTMTERQAVYEAIDLLDRGKLRVAEPVGDSWTVHAWLKEAILLYFNIAEMQVMEVGPFEYYDKIPLKKGLKEQGVRVVPPGTIRYGAFVDRGVVVMPGYINIGAHVGSGTMVDTWATVGSCAQIGRDVHLSGGVGIGGVLEPLQAAPVIVEDGAFVGSRCIVVEGVHIGKEAVLGAGVVLTSSTPIVDVTGTQEKIHRGAIPPRSVVIPGARSKQFPAGTYDVPCALIIGQRQATTDRKTSLTDVLRKFAVQV